MVDAKVKTLLTVVQTGSFTKAAEALNLTQPAVSHHIDVYKRQVFYYAQRGQAHWRPHQRRRRPRNERRHPFGGPHGDAYGY